MKSCSIREIPISQDSQSACSGVTCGSSLNSSRFRPRWINEPKKPDLLSHLRRKNASKVSKNLFECLSSHRMEKRPVF